MSASGGDDGFARYVLQTGMATPAQVEEARKAQSSSAAPISLGEALVRLGVLTPTQREAVDKKLESQAVGQLGPYRLLRKLGEGGMGTVYLAEDPATGRRVAIKVLPKRLAGDPEFLKRFLREAECAAVLDHENIVRGFTAAEEKGYHYYVMEYCEGESLGRWLKREGFLPHARATDLVAQVARGLRYAHERGFIHRDIKPDNIIVTPAGRAKILDLGLSKNLEDTQATFRTVTGAAIGTPHYIAPEQARGEKEVDGRADLYSLGATYYHLITGQVPFGGTSVFEIINKHLTEQLPDPREIRRDVPAGVVQVVRRLMAKRPADRHRDAGELLDDLERLLRDLPPLTAPIDPMLSSVRGARAPAPRRRGPLYLAGAAAAAAVGIIGFSAFSGGPRPEPVPHRPVASLPKPPPPAEPPPAATAPPPRPSETPKVEPPKPPLPEPPKPEPAKPPEEAPQPVTAPPEPPKPQPAKVEPPPPPPLPALTPARPPAVPGAARLKEAEKEFQKLFETDYARKLPSDRQTLAKRLLALEAPADPAHDYVRLRDARDLAAQGGDAETVLAAGERLAATFGLDALAAKAEGLAAVANLKTTDAAASYARACLAAIEEAVAADRYEIVTKLSARAEAAARTSRDDALLETIRARNKDAAAFAAEFQQLRAYVDTIEKRPEDVASNLNLGKFRAFTKDDWEQGLPLLAKGSDPVLRSLAEKEQAAPEGASIQVDLCEGWLAQADKEKSNPLRREHLLARARSWFGKVEARLTEADRTRLAKRLGPAPAAAAPAAAKPAAPALRVGPQPGTFELLGLVDPARDTVHGAWSRSGTGLLSPTGGDNINTGSARIWIPYAPPEEYELFLEVERKAGNEDLVLGLVSPAGKPFAVGLDGWGAQGGCGVFSNGQWSRIGSSRVIGPNGKHTIGIHVRKDRLRVRVQNQDVITVPDYGPLGMPAHVQIPGRTGGLVIGGVRSSFQVHGIVVKPLAGGQGRILAR